MSRYSDHLLTDYKKNIGTSLIKIQLFQYTSSKFPSNVAKSHVYLSTLTIFRAQDTPFAATFFNILRE